MVKETLISKKT